MNLFPKWFGPCHCALLLITGTYAKNIYAQKYEPAHEIVMPQFKMESIEKDLPFKDIQSSQDDKLVWLLGKSSLWQWDLATSKLQRIRLNQAAQTLSSLAHIVPITSNRLLVIGAQNIYDVLLNPMHVDRFNTQSSADIIGYGVAFPKFWWLTPQQINVVDLSQKTMKQFTGPETLKEARFAWINPTTWQLWTINENTLLLQNFKKDRWNDPIVVQQSKNPIINLHHQKDEIFIHTDRNVMVFKGLGGGKTVVPVSPTLKLKSMDIGADFHSYLFSKGLVEIYDLKSQTKKTFKIDLGEDEQIQVFHINGPLMGLIVDDHPRLYWLK